jgi:hypothetical protein
MKRISPLRSARRDEQKNIYGTPNEGSRWSYALGRCSNIISSEGRKFRWTPEVSRNLKALLGAWGDPHVGSSDQRPKFRKTSTDLIKAPRI